MPDGRLEPDFPIATIDQTGTYRIDLGDLEPLCDSLQKLGLLTPVVVTADGALICGKRRLAAAARLGWVTIPAWIPAKVSPKLRLAAQYDDETLRKTLTPIEQAELYAEYEKLYSEQARQRKTATQFGTTKTGNPTTGQAGGDGSGDSPEPPGSQSSGEARVQAAQKVTGTDSHQRLERINELKTIAADQTEHPLVRQDAADALVELNQDGKVTPRWQRVKLGQHLTLLDQTAADPAMSEAARQAAAETAAAVRAQTSPADALREAKQGLTRLDNLQNQTPVPTDPHAVEHRQTGLLADLLRREHGWWERNNPETFGRYADPEQWDLLTTYISGATAFRQQAATARDTPNR